MYLGLSILLALFWGFKSLVWQSAECWHLSQHRRIFFFFSFTVHVFTPFLLSKLSSIQSVVALQKWVQTLSGFSVKIPLCSDEQHWHPREKENVHTYTHLQKHKDPPNKTQTSFPYLELNRWKSKLPNTDIYPVTIHKGALSISSHDFVNPHKCTVGRTHIHHALSMKTHILRAGGQPVGFGVSGQNMGTLSASMLSSVYWFIIWWYYWAVGVNRRQGLVVESGPLRCDWLWSSHVVPRLLLLPVSLQLSWGKKFTYIPSSAMMDQTVWKHNLNNCFLPTCFYQVFGHSDKMLTSIQCCPENRAVWKWFFYRSMRQVKLKIQTKARLFLFKPLLFCSI